MEFSYPPMQEQKDIVRIYRDIDALKYKMNILDERLERLDCYIIHSDAVVVFSSSTDMQTNMGVISKNARLKEAPIKIFHGPAIILSRNGQAGKAMFIDKGAFTINDHAYVLSVKPEYKEYVDLEWFSYVCEKYTKNGVTSKDSNGTFNKEIFLKEQIELIDYEMQKQIVKKKRSLHVIQAKLKCFIAVLGKTENSVSVEIRADRY